MIALRLIVKWGKDVLCLHGYLYINRVMKEFTLRVAQEIENGSECLLYADNLFLCDESEENWRGLVKEWQVWKEEF